jgi:hypothetical protein
VIGSAMNGFVFDYQTEFIATSGAFAAHTSFNCVVANEQFRECVKVSSLQAMNVWVQ